MTLRPGINLAIDCLFHAIVIVWIYKWFKTMLEMWVDTERMNRFVAAIIFIAISFAASAIFGFLVRDDFQMFVCSTAIFLVCAGYALYEHWNYAEEE